MRPTPGAAQAVYNIKATIDIPSNVTLQGESSEWWGTCRIYWLDINANYGSDPDYCNELADGAPSNQRDRPMFRINGATSRVRFRDLAIFSRASGPNCYVRNDFDNIEAEGTAGIELNTDDPYCGGGCPMDPGGDIADVIFENVGIYDFTYGIKAMSVSTDHEISGVKVRGYRAQSNHRQLYIDAPVAYDWDVQNLNISGLAGGQGGVEILNAGRPAGYTGTLGNLKFLQLNCNANRLYPPDFCAQVTNHGGLYFRQTHHEGADKAIIALPTSDTNDEPIVMESGIASGDIQEDSTKLYLVGNAVLNPEKEHPYLDDAHMRFSGDGLNSTLVDCGDVHWDWTDIDGGTANWADIKMLFSHTERYRGGFWTVKDTGNKMPHTYCPTSSPNIAEVGGEYFDSGVLPNEPGLYSNVLNSTTCPQPACNARNKLHLLFTAGGSVYVDGQFTLTSTVTVPRGMQIIGAPGAELTMNSGGNPLFLIEIPTPGTDAFGASAIVLRNLKLKNQAGSTAIDIVGENTTAVGVGRDIHFSGLTIEGFTTGIAARAHASQPDQQPMVDGVSMKSMTFVNNTTGVKIASGNASNWNIMNLVVQSTSGSAVGWDQASSGHQGLQDVRCTGTSSAMSDCIKLVATGGFFLNDLRQTQNVTNALTISGAGVVNSGTIYEAQHATSLVIRNSDLTSATGGMGVMNILGKAFITSMNNKYGNFNVGSTYEGDLSRVTYCNDTYASSAYPGLDTDHDNLWVGMPTPTRIQCGARPVPWDDAVRWTEDYNDNHVGTPLVGNFFDNTKEDFVTYLPASSSKFLIQQPYGPGRLDIYWGTSTYGDIPLVGRFFPSSRAAIAVFRPTTGAWWVNDPNNGSNNVTWSWGVSGDVPFVGNFFDESGSVTGNKDEIAIYRPSNGQIWITNPRTTGIGTVISTTSGGGYTIQVGDFIGAGYDQVAKYQVVSTVGTWKIYDPRTGTIWTATFGTTSDIPVAGRYLTQAAGKDPCIQLGVWRPSDQKFYISDVIATSNVTPFPTTNCGTRTGNMEWGRTNGAYDDDIPLTINTANGALRRPTAYRKTKGVYPAGIGDGQWWVHDPF